MNPMCTQPSKPNSTAFDFLALKIRSRLRSSSYIYKNNYNNETEVRNARANIEQALSAPRPANYYSVIILRSPFSACVYPQT